MISRDDLRRAAPEVDTATTRFLRGEINAGEYEVQIEREREAERRPVGEQTPNGYLVAGQAPPRDDQAT